MQATENQALLSSEPSAKCCYSNTRTTRHSFWWSYTVPTMEPLICFPYLTRLVSNSWHTADGVIPTKKEGQSHITMKLIMVLNSCHTELWYRKKRTSQHMNSFLDHVHEGAEIVLDFRTKSKAMMETILPMIEITLPVMNIIKSAKISKPGLQ